MKTAKLSTILSIVIIAFCFNSGYAEPIDSVFTYEGYFLDGNEPAEGMYDLELTLYDDFTYGSQIGYINLVDDCNVIDGCFTVDVDFSIGDPSAFNGQKRWVEIAYRPGYLNDPNEYTIYEPRQEILPVPYALYAQTAGFVTETDPTVPDSIKDGIDWSEVSGIPSGFADGVDNVGTGDNLGNHTATQNIRLNGHWLSGDGGSEGVYVSNSGSVGIGTTETGAWLDVEVPEGSGGAATIGGSSCVATGYYAVAMGNHTTASENFSTAMGYGTTASGESSTAMGSSTTASGYFSTAMGYGTTASENFSTAMGYGTTASGYASIAMGTITTASGVDSIAMGYGTTASENFSTAMGYYTTASGDYSIAMGRGASSVPLVNNIENSLMVGFGSSPTLFVNSDSVGIGGVTSPEGKLDIATPSSGVALAVGRKSGNASIAASPDADGGWLIMDSTGSGNVGLNHYYDGDVILAKGGGKVGVGRTPSANRLEVEGTASKTTAGSWLANSDGRIKTDVQTITNALEKIDKVRLVSFKYTEDYCEQHPSVEDQRYINVIAQEFQEVFPDYVKSSREKLPNGEDILQVDSYPLIVYSAAAVQELHKIVKAKDAEIDQLKEQNQEIKQRIESLEQMVQQLVSVNEKQNNAL